MKVLRAILFWINPYTWWRLALYAVYAVGLAVILDTIERYGAMGLADDEQDGRWAVQWQKEGDRYPTLDAIYPNMAAAILVVNDIQNREEYCLVAFGTFVRGDFTVRGVGKDVYGVYDH